MSGEENPSDGFDRRKALILLGTGTATASGLAYAILSGRTDPETDTGRTDPETDIRETDPETDPETESPSAENIEDFGATPGTDTKTVARQNTEAIRSAAREAGEHGTVYVPEGDYFFGIADENYSFRFGHDEPKGVSFIGEGPRKSKLIFSSTVRTDKGYRAFRYEREDLDGEDLDHGDVVAKDICFDGNYEELDLSEGETVWGYYAYGDGHFTLDNVWIRGWWATGSKFRGPSATIRHSTFEENAIGVTQADNGANAGHHISAQPPTGKSMLIEDCEFHRCSGSVINRKNGSGDVTLRRAWVRGAGFSCFKLSETNGTTRVENTYVEPRTDWIVQNLPEAAANRGRWFLHRVSGDEYTPTVVLDNVIARNMANNFVLCFGDTDLVLRGTDIAVHNAAMVETHYSRGAIRADNGIEFDIGEMSVHNTEGFVFDAPNATGSIDTLLRDSNDGLGYIGNVSLDDNPESAWLQPNILSRGEGGISSEVDASQE